MAKETWLWGYWKWNGKSGDELRYTFAKGDYAKDEGDVLADCPYGTEVASVCARDQNEVLGSMSLGDGGECTIVSADIDMAMIAAVPELIEACWLLAKCEGTPEFLGSVFFESARDAAVGALAKAGVKTGLRGIKEGHGEGNSGRSG